MYFDLPVTIVFMEFVVCAEGETEPGQTCSSSENRKASKSMVCWVDEASSLLIRSSYCLSFLSNNYNNHTLAQHITSRQYRRTEYLPAVLDSPSFSAPRGGP